MIFSVMIADWETEGSQDYRLKSHGGHPALSLSLVISPSLAYALPCFRSPLLWLSARPFFLRCSASGRDHSSHGARFPVFRGILGWNLWVLDQP